MSETDGDRAAPVPRVWMTAAEAAEYLRISEYQIKEMVREGNLPRYPLRGKRSWRFKIADLDALLEAREEDAS